MYKYLTFKKEAKIGYLILTNPKIRNALCNDMVEELNEVLKKIKDDKNIRVLIISGSGEKAFMGGADIKELKERDFILGRTQTQRRQQIFNEIFDLPIPSIAAINGFAIGAGLELALVCSIRIASENAKFGSPEVNLGIIPGDGATQRLPWIIGFGRALQLILTGEIIDAKKALEIGLVTKIVPQPELLSYAAELAQKLSMKAPLALQYAKEAVNKVLEIPLSGGLVLESYLHSLACASNDKNEGVSAFLEKRKPFFQGK